MSSPARKLILHAGQTKAGSTSIQNYLESQRSSLLEHGFLFPSSVFTRKNSHDPERTSGHLEILSKIQSGDTSAFEAELTEHEGKTVILSIENFFGDRPDNVIQKFAEYFQGWQIELIFVLRPQYDWLRSRYVESVLTGFSASPCLVKALIDEVFENGLLDYPARITQLQKMTGAAKIKAIRFEDDSEPLMKRFLKALSIPITDADLASQIHANRREKQQPLVEAKRRLNMLTSHIPSQPRLEIESKYRASGKRILKEMTSAPFPIEMSEFRVEAMAAGNKQLLDRGILDAELVLGDKTGGLESPHFQELEPLIDELFTEGLKHAGAVVTKLKLSGGHSPVGFSEVEQDALQKALKEHKVSMHIDAVDTAKLAACSASRFVSLLLTGTNPPYSSLSAIDQMDWPSPLVSLLISQDGLQAPAEFLERTGLLPPTLISFGPQVSVDVANVIVSTLRPSAVILRGETREALIDSFFIPAEFVGEFAILDLSSIDLIGQDLFGIYNRTEKELP